MTRMEFLAALREKLMGQPEEDVRRCLDFYSDAIDDRIEDGFTEEAAVEALGPPERIAVSMDSFPAHTAVRSEIEAQKTGEPRRKLPVWQILLLILGAPLWLPLLAAGCVLVLTAVCVLWAVVVTLYAAGVSAAAVVPIALVNAIISILRWNPPAAATYLGVGLFYAGLTLVLFLVGGGAARLACQICGKLWKGLCRFFRRKEVRE